MDAHEVLVAGRNRIDNVGWVQQLFYLRGFRSGEVIGYCPDGACSYPVAALEFRRNDSATRGARMALVRAIGASTIFDLHRWNDAPGRTKQEVLDLFDRAIQATAPAPPFESLGLEPATAREPMTEVFA